MIYIIQKLELEPSSIKIKRTRGSKSYNLNHKKVMSQRTEGTSRPATTFRVLKSNTFTSKTFQLWSVDFQTNEGCFDTLRVSKLSCQNDLSWFKTQQTTPTNNFRDKHCFYTLFTL